MSATRFADGSVPKAGMPLGVPLLMTPRRSVSEIARIRALPIRLGVRPPAPP